MHDTEPDLHPLEHLLDLARAAVIAAVDGRPAPEPDLEAHPELAPTGDAFVTLTERGELRGCMGTLDAGLPVDGPSSARPASRRRPILASGPSASTSWTGSGSR